MKFFQIVAPEFLPVTSYFTNFLNSSVIIADHIQYRKRSSMTRSRLSNNLQLTIPLKKTGYKKAVSQKEIAYSENWDRKHLTSIYHQYHLLPFFEDYFFRLQALYRKKQKYLNHFLFEQTGLFLSLLKIDCQIYLSSVLGFSDSLEESLIRFSQNNQDAVYLYETRDVDSGYIDLGLFSKTGTATRALENKIFSSNLQMNILEFLFRFGPEAAVIIRGK